MEELIERFHQKLQHTPIDFIRSTMEEVDWNARLIGIKGARGIGKTTLLLQYIKLHLSDVLDQTLYVSLDSIWFNAHSLLDTVSTFQKKGGKYLFLDEVHRYEGWSQVLKNLYDDYPQLKIVFTGSSLLEILNARADLSRRAVVYTMQGFSFREYLSLESGIFIKKLTLEEILNNHVMEASSVLQKVKPFQYFDSYLKTGYYPYYQEQPGLYAIRLGEVISMMLEVELPLLRSVDLAYIPKIKQLLLAIGESVPFIPNVSKLSERIGLNRATLLSYLYHLDEIGLTRNLFRGSKGISRLQKPAKLYLENTNLIWVLARENSNRGNLRETFFANQVGFRHALQYTDKGDFFVDEHYYFEVGGKDKTPKQLNDVANGFIVSDDLEIGFGNKIPLWMFGLLY